MMFSKLRPLFRNFKQQIYHCVEKYDNFTDKVFDNLFLISFSTGACVGAIKSQEECTEKCIVINPLGIMWGGMLGGMQGIIVSPVFYLTLLMFPYIALIGGISYVVDCYHNRKVEYK
jgi:hypothetical protein